MIDERIIAPEALLPTPIEYAEIEPEAGGGESLVPGHLGVVRNVKVTLQVKAGETTLSVGELLALREGQVIRLDSLLDAPLQILLEGQCVASGELMAVGDHFAVRVVDTVRPG